ncbi:hypothetical protein [Clostridium sp.]|uniref:hypothetical protein n=1 Tax=Clostridium sp. TaxID=1506 RepID=UPI003990997E
MRIFLPRNNEKRIIKIFAIIPKKIGREIVWLEFVYIRQTYDDFYRRWKDEGFVDEELWKLYKSSI